MKYTFLYILSLFLLAGLANCNKDNNNEPEPETPLPEKIMIAEEYAIGAGIKITFYADENLFVGYNKIYFALSDSVSGEMITSNVNITNLPIMDMGTMMHSCPTEAMSLNSESNQYVGAVVFVMPSTAGTWTMTSTVENTASGDIGIAQFQLEVIEPDEAKLTSFISALDPSASYFISLIQPKNPKIGENEFEILINRRASMMSWPYEPYLTVEIDPQMPSMNHGSPNNVNPIHTEDGHYLGVVNFTMTGWWQVNMIIKDGEGNVLADDVFFNITFQ